MKNVEEKNYEGVKAFLIARVSDPRQVDALPAQELRLNEYAERLKLDSVLHSFDETAYKEDRAKFIEIIDEVTKYPNYYVLVFDNPTLKTPTSTGKPTRLECNAGRSPAQSEETSSVRKDVL